MPEYAEDLPYFKTSSSGPDAWMAKAAKEIDKAGGAIISEGFGSSVKGSAYMIRFTVDGETYRVVWPTAQSKWEHKDPSKFDRDARRQAATMLFHDVKASCVKARALGFKVAFFAHLELEDGRVASEAIGGVGDLPQLSP